MCARIALLMLVLAVPVVGAQEDDKPTEKQEVPAYDALWKKVEKSVADRNYLIAIRLVEDAVSDPALANDQDRLAALLKDLRLLEGLRKRVLDKGRALKPGDTVTIGKMEHRFVRFEPEPDKNRLVATFPGSTTERFYPLNADTWLALAALDDSEEATYLKGLLHAVDRHGSHVLARQHFSATTHPHAHQWVKHLNAIKEEEKRKKDEEVRKKEEEKRKKAEEQAEKDPFKVGETYNGQAFVPKIKPFLLTLTITGRKGTTFTGDLQIVDQQINDRFTVPVKGTAPVGNGPVKFRAGPQGKLDLHFTGKFEKGELGYQFNGKGVTGGSIIGNGFMR